MQDRSDPGRGPLRIADVPRIGVDVPGRKGQGEALPVSLERDGHRAGGRLHGVIKQRLDGFRERAAVASHKAPRRAVHGHFARAAAGRRRGDQLVEGEGFLRGGLEEKQFPAAIEEVERARDFRPGDREGLGRVRSPARPAVRGLEMERNSRERRRHIVQESPEEVTMRGDGGRQLFLGQIGILLAQESSLPPSYAK